MNVDRYEYIVNELQLDYQFESNGPNGKIKKLVTYTPQNANGLTYFNIAFGDLNEETGKLDDKSISNNKDTVKILSTVAATVLEFTHHFPDVMVYATGSTRARTRLYQMGISANIDEIELSLKVFGFTDGRWQSFEKNINYEAFLVIRKV